MRIEPFPPEEGKEFRIIYRQDDPGAAYKNATEIEATIFCELYNARPQVYRLRLQRSGSLFFATCRLPDNAYYATISIQPPGALRSREKALSFAIHTAELPKMGAIPTLLQDPSIDDSSFAALWNYDHELYPSSHWRWLPRWIRLLKHKQYARILHEADSLWHSLLPESDPSGSSVCLFAFTATRQWKQAKQALEQLHSSLSRPVRLPLSLFEDCLTQTWLALRAQEEAVADTLRMSLITLCQSYPFLCPLETWLLLPTVMGSPSPRISPTLPERQEQIHHQLLLLWSRQYTSASPSDILATGGNVILLARAFLQEIRDTSTTIRLLERAWETLSPLSGDTLYRGCSFPVLPAPTAGVIAGLLCDLGTLLLSVAPPRAFEAFTRLFQLSHPLARGSQSLAAIAISRYYLSREQIDSALQYWAVADQLGSPFADSLWSDIRQTARTCGRSLPSQEAIRSQYFRSLRDTPEPIAIVDNTGRVLSPSSKDPVILLFSSATCGLCKLWYPRLLRRIVEERIRAEVCLITPDGSSIPNIPAKIAVSSADLTPDVEQAYGVVGSPTVVVLHQGTIRYNSGLSSQEQLERIVQLLKELSQ